MRISRYIEKIVLRLFKYYRNNRFYYVSQIRYFLFEDGQPIGKAYSSRMPNVRIVPVRSFSDAYCFFIKLSDQRLLTYRQAIGHLFYTMTLPKNKGKLELSDKPNKKDKRIIAVLKTDIAEIAPQLSEIRFIIL